MPPQCPDTSDTYCSEALAAIYPDGDVRVRAGSAFAILANSLFAHSEEEWDQRLDYYDELSHEEQIAYRDQNWQHVFDVPTLHADWMIRGDWIQAAFWELKKQYVRKVRFFRTAHKKALPSHVFHTTTALRSGDGTIVRVTFDDGTEREYDAASLFERHPFMQALEDRDLFLSGTLSPGGYGIIWTDDIDLDIETVYHDGHRIS